MKERPKEFYWFEGNRILMRRLVNRRQRLMASLTENTYITNKNLYTLLPYENHFDLEYYLGVLNSKLISFLYIQQVSQAIKDDFPQVTIKDIKSLPFPITDSPSVSIKEIALNVKSILSLHLKLKYAKTTHQQTALKRQIEATDNEIDRLVYELYGLTDEEIQIVEEA